MSADHKATASCSCRSIQHRAWRDLATGSEGDSTSVSTSPKEESQSQSVSPGLVVAVEEDTTRGIGGGEEEESLDPGIPAKREERLT